MSSASCHCRGACDQHGGSHTGAHHRPPLVPAVNGGLEAADRVERSLPAVARRVRQVRVGCELCWACQRGYLSPQLTAAVRLREGSGRYRAVDVPIGLPKASLCCRARIEPSELSVIAAMTAAVETKKMRQHAKSAPIKMENKGREEGRSRKRTSAAGLGAATYQARPRSWPGLGRPLSVVVLPSQRISRARLRRT